MSSSRIKKAVPYLLTLTVIAVMTGAAELTGNCEIIFPEITAVAVGALIAPVQPWNTNRLRLFLSISAMSLAGVLLVRFVPLPLIIKLPLAFFCAAAGLMISKTGFVPMISACVLPVILGTETFIYVISVIIMTGIILALQYLLDKAEIHKPAAFTPAKLNKGSLFFWLKHTIIIAAAAAVPVLTGELYFIVPPLIVGYAEMSFPGSKLRGRYKTAVLLILIASCSGVLCRLLLNELAGLPLTAAAVISGAAVLLAVRLTGLYFPPCGAICTLPMLLSAEHLIWYPAEATIGFIVLTALALNLFPSESKGDKKMILDFKTADEAVFEGFKGGEGALSAKMYSDDKNRILHGRLEPGSSIGFHSHDENSEIIYILNGSGTVIFDSEKEAISEGMCHYCPKGHSHSLINSGDTDLVFFAVVPQQ